MNERSTSRDENRDPITGEPGAHPVGTGVGAAGAGLAGAAAGMAVGGPVGGVIGAVVGAVAGGAGGHSVAESIDPTAEDAYWRENHKNASYSDSNRSFEDYSPAYRAGYNGFERYAGEGKSFDAAEPDLRRDYDSESASLDWDDARPAARAAWDRVENRRES